MIVAFTGAGISKESGINTFEDDDNIRIKMTREFASHNKYEYRKTMQKLVTSMENKKPNDAHLALAEYDVKIITMNIDNLHEIAGSKDILKIHGRLPKRYELKHCELLEDTPVLYGDEATLYNKAYEIIEELTSEDTLLIIGASNYTNVAQDIREIAKRNGVQIVEIQDNAVERVRKALEKYTENNQ